MRDVTRVVVATLVGVIVTSLQVVMVTGYDVSSLSRSSSSSMKLKIQEVHKVMRDADPSGRNSSVEILLQEHDPIPNLSRWGLSFMAVTGDSYINQEIPAESTTQRELLFPVDITHVAEFYVVATNTTSNVVAFTSYKVVQGYLDSQLAWVGGEYDTTTPSSLRVVPGSKMKKVEVVMEAEGEAEGVKEECMTSDSPCYYLSSTRLPQEVPRCMNRVSTAEGDVTKQCDDVIAMYKEMPVTPTLELTNNTLTVTANYTVQPAAIEAVVFDPTNASVVYSPEGYKCHLKKQPRSQLMTSCTQQLVLIEGEEDGPQKIKLPLSVLLVALDVEGFVLESRLDIASELVEQKRDTRGVLAACIVLACFFGIGLLLSATLYFLKERKDKKRVGSSRRRQGSSRYQKAATSEPPPVQAPPSSPAAASPEEVPLRQETITEPARHHHHQEPTTAVTIDDRLQTTEGTTEATGRTPVEPPSPETYRTTEEQSSATERTPDGPSSPATDGTTEDLQPTATEKTA